ncbi:Succinate dehydrogenase cytochrome [Zancudomyces culisetae]|uniref:Succinate dehydrogenase cytochrome n=1 Tax=Zancudomyces culisetae TaxID=1213189 RepID=A0A1R1PJB2_ZANCU|nr:Succinate dehydrogenase cytochrome [Zancudomyces culisetae]OMH83163.1 Succinate dehydrogenase cytochrome [Zancudomyces culisetae]|eukprot:OMH81003.1 Succinate dehydrogenase cytochrome [Zancudomyces culisetae]
MLLDTTRCFGQTIGLNSFRSVTTQAEKAKHAKLNRPVSPHFGAFKPPTSMIYSGGNRISALILSFTGLAGTALLGLGSTIGYYVDAPTAASVAAALPALIFYPAKLFFSSVFSYHTVEGVRRLLWRTGFLLSPQQMRTSGYVVLGLVATLASYLTFF